MQEIQSEMSAFANKLLKGFEVIINNFIFKLAMSLLLLEVHYIGIMHISFGHTKKCADREYIVEFGTAQD